MRRRVQLWSGCLVASLWLQSCGSDSEMGPNAPMLSEMMLTNTWSLKDQDGDFWPWIELHNPTEGEVTLSGLSLHSLGGAQVWELPDSTVDANTFTLVHFSGKAISATGTDLHLASIEDQAALGFELRDAKGDVLGKLGAPEREQHRDVSYGIVGSLDGGPSAYLTESTPGFANGAGSARYRTLPPKLSVSRGIYSEPFELTLYPRGEVVLTFSQDGQSPAQVQGEPYTAPLQITTNSVIRAMALSDEYGPSSVETHTYIFLADTIMHPNMDSAVTSDPVEGDLMEASLRSRTVLALTSGGELGSEEESSVSIELLGGPELETGFQIDCGAKFVGQHSLRNFEKKSVRLYFKEEFGPKSLEYPLFKNFSVPGAFADTNPAFDQLYLRSGSHDSIFYLGTDVQPPANAQYLRNRFMQDTLALMGHLSTKGRFVQVFWNGDYHGIYHLQERPTAAHLAGYLGGDKSQYAYTNSGTSDDLDVWAQVKDSAQEWSEAESWIDIDALVDNQLLQYYAGNDWDWLKNRNWMAAGPRESGKGGWRFFSWDSDLSFVSENADNTDPTGFARTNQPLGAPDGLFDALTVHPEFVARVQERIALHMTGEGLLTPDSMIRRYRELADSIELSLVAESARWSDIRGRQWRVQTDWIKERDRLLSDYFTARTDIVLAQLRARGLWPTEEP